MKIRCLAINKEVVSSVTTKHYPVDWVGEVPDQLATEWISAGTAVALHQHDVPALTAQETAVLKGAAQQIIAAVQAGDSGETVDPETGEITPAQSPAETLASLTATELKALAKQHGVKTTARRRADIEAELLTKITAAA